jgi:hypothetical protein
VIRQPFSYFGIDPVDEPVQRKAILRQRRRGLEMRISLFEPTKVRGGRQDSGCLPRAHLITSIFVVTERRILTFFCQRPLFPDT